MSFRPAAVVAFFTAVLPAASCCHARPSVESGPAAWRTAALPGAPDDLDIVALSGTSSHDVWAVGNERGSSRPFVYHFDGTLWLLDRVSSLLPSRVRDVATVGPDDVWMVVDSAVMAHYDGADWTLTTVEAARRAGHQLDHVHVSQAGVWVTWERGAAGYYRHDGRDWQLEGAPGIPTQTLTSAWGSAPDDVWAVGGRAWHYDGAMWTEQTVGKASLNAVHGTARDDVWIVGSRGTSMSMWAHKACVFRYDGASWTEVPVPEGVLMLRAIHAVSRTEVYAVGNGADAVRWDGTSWRRMLTGMEKRSGLPWLGGVFCAAAGKPMAGGAIGPVILHGI